VTGASSGACECAQFCGRHCGETEAELRHRQTTRNSQEISQNINSPGFDRGMTLGNCLLVGRNELQGGKILVDILGD